MGALGGCQNDPPDEAAVLEEAGQLVDPEPGLYRSTTTLTRFALPRASPQEAERMRLRMESLDAQTSKTCLTEKEARRGFAGVIEEMQEGDCLLAEFETEGGRLDAQLTCTGIGGVISRVDVSGEGTPTTSRMEIAISQDGPGIPGGTQEIALLVENERIGDCPEASAET